MNAERDMAGLVDEMLAVEAETFEVEDYADPSQRMGGDACATTTSTTSSCGSTSCA